MMDPNFAELVDGKSATLASFSMQNRCKCRVAMYMSQMSKQRTVVSSGADVV